MQGSDISVSLARWKSSNAMITKSSNSKILTKWFLYRSLWAQVLEKKLQTWTKTMKWKKKKKRQLWARPIEWLKLKLASRVVHQTRSLVVLILYFNYNIVFVNWTYDMVVSSQFHKLYGGSFERVLHLILMKNINRWLRWMLPGSTGRYSITIVCTGILWPA